MRSIALSFFLLLFSSNVVADWDVTLGGIDSEHGASVMETSDGGFIVAGMTTSLGAGEADMWLVKTDMYGTAEWDKTFGGPNFDWGYDVRQTSDGGYIICGERQADRGDMDVYVVKTDSNGNTEWESIFGLAGGDACYSIEEVQENGYILTGYTSSYGAGRRDVWLIRIDENGNMLWNNTFGGPDSDHGNSVKQTSDGGFIIGGRTTSFAANSDAWLIKTNLNGYVEWSKIYGGDLSETCYDVQESPDGGFVFVAETFSYGEGAGDILLAKTDRYGNVLWDKTFGDESYNTPRSLRRTADGGFIIAGYTVSSETRDNNVLLLKTDAEGNLKWSRTFGGPDEDRGQCIRQTTDGGFIISGDTLSFGMGAWDAWLIKTDAQLTQLNLLLPADGATLSSAPTFEYLANGGEDNRFAVDIALSPEGPFRSTWEDLRRPIHELSWTMPNPVWSLISPGQQVYWRVRAADLDSAPLTPIYSEEVWSLYKE